MSLKLPCQRDLFEMPDDIAYLNCAYMSPLLRSVREAGEAGVVRKSRPWRITARDFFAETETARALFAELIGADAEGIAAVPSASYGIGVAAANLPLAAGRRILLLDEQFPSNVYAWRDLAARTGGEVVTVHRPPDLDWTSALLAALDERTAIVALPQCHWTDGSLIELARVGDRARQVGAALVIDASQSLGAYPLDMATVRPDFLVAPTYKWLLGPYSLGFLYVAPQHRDGRPLEFSWMTREDSEDFTGLVLYRDAFQPGARRYDVGEHSNFALMPMAIAALRQLLAWRVDDIAATLGELTSLVEVRASRLGLEPVPSDRRASHLIGLRSKVNLPADLTARLAAEQVYVSVRGNSIRVSPHLYNTRADVERLFQVLASALS
jgi:selenocysteine lyase/cysteine desulfurase